MIAALAMFETVEMDDPEQQELVDACASALRLRLGGDWVEGRELRFPTLANVVLLQEVLDVLRADPEAADDVIHEIMELCWDAMIELVGR